MKPRREPHGTLGFLGDRLQPVEGVVGAPSSGEDAGMGLAGVDQRLELRFGEQAGSTTSPGGSSGWYAGLAGATEAMAAD